MIVFFGINLLPESPRWLIKHDYMKDGTEVLAKLRGLPETDVEVIAERDSIVASFESQAGHAPFKYSELWSGGKTRTGYR